MNKTHPGDSAFSYKIQYISGKRKLDYIIVNREEIIIRAPRRLKPDQIHEIITENSDTIIKALKEAEITIPEKDKRKPDMAARNSDGLVKNRPKTAASQEKRAAADDTPDEGPMYSGSVTIGDTEIPFSVEYSSRRRRVSIEIREESKVVVKAPSATKMEQIYSILYGSQDWLLLNCEIVKKAGVGGKEHSSVSYKGTTYPYVVRYHTRAVNCTIKIYEDNSIYVTAPTRMPREEIHSFVKSNTSFIHETINAPGRKPSRAIEFKNGAEILLNGKIIRIKTVRGKSGREPVLKKGTLTVTLPEKPSEELKDDYRIADAVSTFLRKNTQKEFSRYLPKYAKALNLKIPETEIRFYKSYWGKCIPDRGLVIFNERLAMLPRELIEYVVAHELCHFYHPNHGKEFHKTLNTVMPDADARKKRLKTYNTSQINGYIT
ncbi:MAG: SprT family zinc-dependent metalloprotease [Euryarchaeota archaeon]|nr:SprT family zinc-dependent metalloprotease [Euryarchaeota archaeon]